MLFSEIARTLKPCFEPEKSGGEFVLDLIDKLLRDPIDKKEEELVEKDTFNPLKTLEQNTLDKIYGGSAFISRKNASYIHKRLEKDKLIYEIDDLLDTEKESLILFLKDKGISLDKKQIGEVVADILKQIIYGLSKGTHDVEVIVNTVSTPKSIKELAENRIYFENGKLVFDGEVIELPIKLDESTLYTFEKGYISALCDAYADALLLDNVSIEDIPSLPKKYQVNFNQQRKAYLSAESIQRSMRDVSDDGENQFDILKEDIYDGIRTTYYDDYNSGYQRLLEVLKKVSDIQLTKSKIMLIKNLIGNLERLGIVHILVNDKTIKSWVDPYEE